MNKYLQFARNYMPNIVFNPWVKNVNNWRVETGINIGQLSTEVLTGLQNYIVYPTKRYFSEFITTYLYPTLYTPKYTKYNLLSKSYPINPQSLLLRLINEI